MGLGVGGAGFGEEEELLELLEEGGHSGIVVWRCGD